MTIAKIALEILRGGSQGVEILNDPHFLIKQTLQEINKAWISGTLPWMRANKSEEWERMKALEEKINKAALEGNIEGLREALDSYKGLFLTMVEELKALTAPIKEEPYRIYSNLLKACLWIVPTDEDMKALMDEGVTEPIYIADEIRKLKVINKETLKTAHMIKMVFPGSKTIH